MKRLIAIFLLGTATYAADSWGQKNLGGLTSLRLAAALGGCSDFLSSFALGAKPYLATELQDLMRAAQLKIDERADPYFILDLTCIPVRIGGEVRGHAVSVNATLMRSINIEDTGARSVGAVWGSRAAFICTDDCVAEIRREAKGLAALFLSERSSPQPGQSAKEP